MTSDSEARAVEEFLLSNPENLATALAVYDSWPAVRDRVCNQFLEHLRVCIGRSAKEKISKFAHDVEVGTQYGRFKKEDPCLWLYRTSWAPYNAENSLTDDRTYIFIYADGGEPNGWYYGVGSPMPASNMSEDEQLRRSDLDQRLKATLGIGRRSDWNPQWAYVDDRMRNWYSLAPGLLKECRAGGGEITDYFVNVIMDVAVKAIPVINEIERNSA